MARSSLSTGNAVVKIFGHFATVLFGDPAVYDRYRWLRRNLAPGPLCTLDAGCGSGSFTMYAAKRGNDALGVSFEERNNAAASERARVLGLGNVKFMTADLKKLDGLLPQIGAFDQIICCETIEHIMDDAKLVRDFALLLLPGGRVLITTPYKHGRFWRNATYSEVENGDHVRIGYDEGDFVRLFSDAGLALVRVDYVSGFFTQKLLVVGQALSRRMNPKLVWAMTFPFRALQLLDPLFARFGCTALSIAVVGQKNN